MIKLLAPCLLAGLGATALGACAVHPAARHAAFETSLAADENRFGPRPDILEEAAIFALSGDQERAFLDFFHHRARQRTPPHERLHDYLLRVAETFDFHNDTRTASQALTSGSGNCLTLAILTSALARLVELDVDYELVDATPVFERRGTVVSRGVHVRSIVYDPRWRKLTDTPTGARRPGISFDYFPDDTVRVRLVGNLSEGAYIAMYYSNVAGEALAANDLGGAYWLLREALRHDPGNAIALNSLAVVYRHSGDPSTAERIYQYGIEFLGQKASFLRNYVALLTVQGRSAEAAAMRASLERLEDHNPFSWVAAGRNALAAGEYREAARYFQQALKVAPYLHEAHALTAMVYLKLGDQERAERALAQAMANAQRVSTRSLYAAKLAALETDSPPP